MTRLTVKKVDAAISSIEICLAAEDLVPGIRAQLIEAARQLAHVRMTAHDWDPSKGDYRAIYEAGGTIYPARR